QKGFAGPGEPVDLIGRIALAGQRAFEVRNEGRMLRRHVDPLCERCGTANAPYRYYRILPATTKGKPCQGSTTSSPFSRPRLFLQRCRGPACSMSPPGRSPAAGASGLPRALERG